MRPALDKERPPLAVRIGLKPGTDILTRPDQWFYFISLPVSVLFAGLGLSPNVVGLVSLVCGLGFIAGLFMGLPTRVTSLCLVLLGLRIILDCADGQLARLSGRTSTLGALYDLTSDFLFLVLTAVSLPVFLIRQGYDPAAMIILSIVGFLCAAGSSTAHTFYDTMLSPRETDLSQATNRFVQPPENDRPMEVGYSAKLAFFSLLFRIGWGSVSKPVVSIILQKKRIVFPKIFMLLLFPVEYGVQVTVLLVLAGSDSNLISYFIFQAATVVYTGILAAVFGRR